MELNELQKHIRSLAALPETGAPVISCYLDTSEPGYRHELDGRARLLSKSLTGEARRDFEEALDRIYGYLRAGALNGARGAAIFSRAGEQPFFLSLHFRVPLPNRIAISSTPNIYHLVELKDTYDRYVVLIATEQSSRILGVNLGAATQEIWRQRPEMRERVGRVWTEEHYQNRRREQTNRFINELISVLDQQMSAGGYGHLVLAGSPRVTSRIGRALPRRLAAKVVDIVPASECDRTSDVVAATLAAFIEREEQESLTVVDKLQKEINTHGLAVAGTRASFEALRQAAVDVLVLAKAYEADSGWTCDACGVTEFEWPRPGVCIQCGARMLRELNVKEEMVRMAAQIESGVEVVSHSDALMRLGGVGCLLRFMPPDRRQARAA